MHKAQSTQIREGADATGHHLARRDFLKISGFGLFVFISSGFYSSVNSQQRRRDYPTDINAYLKIGEDGRVSVYCSKVEMGQGIITSMAQMLAEELDVSLESIDMVMGDTMLCPWDSGTTGSRSTKNYGPPLRQAGAEARSVLLKMASEQLKLATGQLVVANGVVRDKKDGTTRVTYAELVKGKQIERNITGVKTKPNSQHTICGKPTRRIDARSKVTGEAAFASDIRLPNMLYAKVLRPPFHGATLKSVDVSKAQNIENTIVIQKNDLIAVLHRDPELAENALNSISAKWNSFTPEVDNQSIFDHLKKSAPDGRVHIEKGDPNSAYVSAEKKVESEFYNHYVAHAPIEPYSVIADVRDEKVTVWASTQAPFRVRRTIAETLKISEEKIHVITPFLGGGFGGKKSGQQISECVRLSKIMGRPVQLAWSRREEFFFDTFRPAAVVQLKSGLDGDGHITSWNCDLLFTGSRSSEPIYNIPHFKVKSRSRGNVHPFRTGAWRGPGSNTNVFAMESHTDILARSAEMDPFQFRINNLTDERMIRVLNMAADEFGHKFKKGPSGNGYGISCTNYLNSYVATIAQVNVNESSGEVRVKRVVCAQDMGEIINPQGAKLQIEGGIMMGLSAALSEEIEFEGGEIKTRNFDSYQITRFSHTPEINVVLVENPDLPPQGCGEPAITTIGAALANAIFDAVGARLFILPMTPKRILAAMDS